MKLVIVAVLFSVVAPPASASAWQAAAAFGATVHHYRFKACVRLSSGKTLTSGLFYSRGPARRRFTLSLDTSDEGCWAKRVQRPLDVDLEGCRGEGCRVQAFVD